MSAERITLGILTCSVYVRVSCILSLKSSANIGTSRIRFCNVKCLSSPHPLSPLPFPACDCNMDGTGRPACDSYTGECICRAGVMGIFCDECAPGYEPNFPECTPCHPCSQFWVGNISDVRQAAQKMRSLFPSPAESQEPDYSPRFQKMKEKLIELSELVNSSSISLPEIMNVEEMCTRIQYVHL